MTSRITRFVTAAVAGCVVTLSAAGVATAGTIDSTKCRSGTECSTPTAVSQVQQLHDALAASVQAGDVSAAKQSVDSVRTLMAHLNTAPMPRTTMSFVVTADQQAAELQRQLPELPGLPGLDILAPLADLVSALLSTLMNLVSSLLGGALPELPGLPDLPIPDLPGVPLPEPGLPEAPEVPEVPELPVPEPELPEAPDLPVPEPELPEAPLPDAPLPEAPLP